MHWIDILLIICLLWAVWSGARKGIIVQLGSIFAVVLGIWLAYRYSERVGAWLGIDESIAYYVAFILIVIVCVVVISLIGWLLGKIFNLVGLGLLNRIGGALLSLVKTVLILGALLIAFDAVNRHTHTFGQRQFDDSLLYGPLVRTTHAALPFLREAIGAIDFTGE